MSAPAAPLRAAVLPPVPALLPEHAGLVDPVAGLRAACDAALGDLLAGAGAVVVLHDPADAADHARGVGEPVAVRVALALLRRSGWTGHTWCRTPDDETPLPADAVLLVMANGSARRGERAPGHLDERAFGFDDEVEAALASADPGRLGALDAALGDELMAAGTRCLRRLGGLLGAAAGARPAGPGGPAAAALRWAGDPYGVQYWVVVLGPGARGHA